MALPLTTGSVLMAAYGLASGDDRVDVRHDSGQITVAYWDAELGVQPTEQQITDWATDTTPLPNGQLFSQWQAEHGGDAAQTLRRKAKEIIDKPADNAAALRAVVIELVNHINAQNTKYNDLLQWLGGQTALVGRGQLNGMAATIPTLQQARDAIKDRISNGEADS